MKLNVAIFLTSIFLGATWTARSLAASVDLISPEWAESGAVLALPALSGPNSPSQITGIKITDVNPPFLEGSAIAGNLDSDGEFLPNDRGFTFKITKLRNLPAIRFYAKNLSLYIDEHLRIFVAMASDQPDRHSRIQEIGDAVVARPIDHFILKPRIRALENFGRVDTGPQGEVQVHGRFIYLSAPVTVFGRSFRVLRFGNYSPQTRKMDGRLEFGNIDPTGSWNSGYLTTVWKYSRSGVDIGGVRGVPHFAILNQTSHIANSQIAASTMSIIDHERRYMVTIARPLSRPAFQQTIPISFCGIMFDGQ